jgi:hypothetical protein
MMKRGVKTRGQPWTTTGTTVHPFVHSLLTPDVPPRHLKLDVQLTRALPDLPDLHTVCDHGINLA